MYKLIFFLGLILGANNVSAQNLTGITRVNTKAGTVIDAPRLDSKHYKIQVPISQNDIELRVFFYEYVNGKYIQSNMDQTMNVVIPKTHKFIVDFVPQLEPTGMFKLYLFYPGVTRYFYMFCNDNTCLKYVPYEKTKTKWAKKQNTLLVYEDTKDGEMEKLVNSYIVDGVLRINSQSDIKLRTLLKRYSILYYTIKERKK